MRTIKQSSQFKRDFKRETKGLYRQVIKDEFLALVSILAQDRLLAEKYRDHALIGRWKDHRDCHIRPDLVLIYRKIDETALQLVRLGSHSALGL